MIIFIAATRQEVLFNVLVHSSFAKTFRRTSKRKDALVIVELARKTRKIEKSERSNEGAARHGAFEQPLGKQ